MKNFIKCNLKDRKRTLILHELLELDLIIESLYSDNSKPKSLIVNKTLIPNYSNMNKINDRI